MNTLSKLFQLLLFVIHKTEEVKGRRGSYIISKQAFSDPGWDIFLLLRKAADMVSVLLCTVRCLANRM